MNQTQRRIRTHRSAEPVSWETHLGLCEKRGRASEGEADENLACKVRERKMSACFHFPFSVRNSEWTGPERGPRGRGRGGRERDKVSVRKLYAQRGVCQWSFSLPSDMQHWREGWLAGVGNLQGGPAPRPSNPRMLAPHPTSTQLFCDQLCNTITEALNYNPQIIITHGVTL